MEGERTWCFMLSVLDGGGEHRRVQERERSTPFHWRNPDPPIYTTGSVEQQSTAAGDSSALSLTFLFCASDSSLAPYISAQGGCLVVLS